MSTSNSGAPTTGDSTTATRSIIAEVRVDDPLLSNSNLSSNQVIHNPFDAVRQFVKCGRLNFHGNLGKSGRAKRKAEFNGDTFARLASEHYEKHEIPKTFRKLAERSSRIVHSGPTVVQINNVATFSEVSFMICKRTNRLVSVRHPEQRVELLKRGFSEIHCDHFTGEGLDCLPEACEVEVEPVQRLSENGVPVEVTLPVMDKGKLPAMHQNKDEKICSAIIRAFEEKVVVFEGGSQRTYSPYHLWTDELRKSKGWLSRDTKWLKRCKIYWICKIMLRGDYPSIDPILKSAADITESTAQLEKRATDHRHLLEREGSVPRDMNWFDLALEAFSFRGVSDSH